MDPAANFDDEVARIARENTGNIANRANRSAAWSRRCSVQVTTLTEGERAMTQPPLGMDPTARFDDEVARIARENDADVIFQLVEREDSSMKQCYVHHPDTPAPATHYMKLAEPGREPQHIEVCKECGIWINNRDLTKEPPSPVNQEHVEKLRPAVENRETTITGGKISRAPDQDRNTIGLNPPGYGRDDLLVVVRSGRSGAVGLRHAGPGATGRLQAIPGKRGHRACWRSPPYASGLQGRREKRSPGCSRLSPLSVPDPKGR